MKPPSMKITEPGEAPQGIFKDRPTVDGAIFEDDSAGDDHDIEPVVLVEARTLEDLSSRYDEDSTLKDEMVATLCVLAAIVIGVAVVYNCLGG